MLGEPNGQCSGRRTAKSNRLSRAWTFAFAVDHPLGPRQCPQRQAEAGQNGSGERGWGGLGTRGTSTPSRHTAGTEGQERMTRGATPSLARLRGGQRPPVSKLIHLRRLSRKGNPVRVQRPRNTPRSEDFQVVSTVGLCWRLTHITRNSHSPSFLISLSVVLPAQV